MNLTETAAMVAYLMKARPQQRFDDETVASWAPSMDGISREDALAVMPEIVASVEWITVTHIVAAVKRLRRDRLARAGFDTICPNVDPDDVARYAAERRALRDAIASGQMTTEHVAAYSAGEAPPLTGGRPYAVAALESARPGCIRAALARIRTVEEA